VSALDADVLNLRVQVRVTANELVKISWQVVQIISSRQSGKKGRGTEAVFGTVTMLLKQEFIFELNFQTQNSTRRETREQSFRLEAVIPRINSQCYVNVFLCNVS